MKKQIFSLLTVGALMLSMGAAAEQEPLTFKAGTYESRQFGMGGYFNVQVTFSDQAIESISAPDNKETKMVGTEAIRILSDRIIDNQSLDVDIVASATYSSYALIAGVTDCVRQAGGDVDALKARPAPVETYADQTHEADIVIVGGGLAGVTAALKAQENGSDVILLEEKEFVGGNSVLSTGTFIFGGSSIQAGLGIEDDPDTFYQWAIDNSNGAKDPVQVAMVAYHGQELIDYYATLGVYFNEKKVNATDGSKVNRGHALTPNIGTAVSTMANLLTERSVDIRYGTKAVGLITDENGAVIGVQATDYYGEPVSYYGNHIVLASGGWGDNNEMIVTYWGEDYDGLVYGGSKGMDGAMLNAAVSLGADLVDMNDAHIDATLEVTHGITITTNVLRNCGGILVRQETGERFADEQSSHSEIAAAKMHELGDPYYYEIADQSLFEYSEAVTAKAESYVNMGLTKQYDSIAAMAADLGLDETALTHTIDTYNQAVRGEIEDPFGRTQFADELQAPFYVLKVSNGVACTTGGLRIDDQFRVLDMQGNPINQLYAIGEITGGYRVHYVGGDSLSHSGISGMLVAEELTK